MLLAMITHQGKDPLGYKSTLKGSTAQDVFPQCFLCVVRLQC